MSQFNLFYFLKIYQIVIRINQLPLFFITLQRYDKTLIGDILTRDAGHLYYFVKVDRWISFLLHSLPLKGQAPEDAGIILSKDPEV